MAKLPKKHMARQYGALPFRWFDDKLEVMLITSRDTGRWIIPKGWPIEKLKPRQVAMVEAYEEAGLRGKIFGKKSLGRYRYSKFIEDERPIDCEVTVFAMRVERQLKKWPERSQRETRWFSPEAAAPLLSEPELKTIVLALPTSLEPKAMPVIGPDDRDGVASSVPSRRKKPASCPRKRGVDQ